MFQAPIIRPPRIAVYLIDLFTSPEQAESIPGDLVEEFSEIASKWGLASARHWYWRQSVKTIPHLIGSGFRAAPWQITGSVLVGILLTNFGFRLPEMAIVAALRRYPVHVNLTLLWNFWVPFAVEIGTVIVAMFVGCAVAMATKGREMISTSVLGLNFGAFSGVLFLILAKHWPEYPFILLSFILLHQLVVQFARSIAVVIGGGIVRTTRSALSRCPPANQH